MLATDIARERTVKNTVTLRAVYENGVIRLLEPAELVEGQEVQVLAPKKEAQLSRKGRTPNLHRGSMYMSDDFDEPLPDSFWLGEEE